MHQGRSARVRMPVPISGESRVSNPRVCPSWSEWKNEDRLPFLLPAPSLGRIGSRCYFHLQRTLGNQWVAELIKTGRLTPEGKITWLQPKLTVGAADDLLSNSCQCCAQKWQSLGKKDESDKGMRSSCRHSGV